jgi:uncharacterized protein (DUF608 family)
LEIADAGVIITNIKFDNKSSPYYVVIPSYKNKEWKLAQYFIKINGNIAIGDFNNTLKSGTIIGIASNNKTTEIAKIW